MTTQHTPGPWVVDPDTATATIRSETGTSVARCYQGDEDARLIAAAPDLLAACGALMKAEGIKNGERNGYVMGCVSIAIDKAQAAIAKATTNS